MNVAYNRFELFPLSQHRAKECSTTKLIGLGLGAKALFRYRKELCHPNILLYQCKRQPFHSQYQRVDAYSRK